MYFMYNVMYSAVDWILNVLDQYVFRIGCFIIQPIGCNSTRAVRTIRKHTPLILKGYFCFDQSQSLKRTKKLFKICSRSMPDCIFCHREISAFAVTKYIYKIMKEKILLNVKIYLNNCTMPIQQKYILKPLKVTMISN